MLKRIAAEYIDHWIQTGKTALLVTGARQVGKTYLIEHLLQESGTNYVKFDLIEQPEIIQLLDSPGSSSDLVLRFTAAAGKPLPAGSVIFLDEIQQYKEIVTKIKFLVEEGTYRYILSGSLLGVKPKLITSAPVGYLSILKMFPMDFREFCVADGQTDVVLDALKDCFDNDRAVDPVIHDIYMGLFYKYLVVGGMPQAVQEYLDTNNLQSVGEVLTQIRNLYYLDFTKYAEDRDKLKIRDIYDRIPSELNKQNKRFIFTHLNKELKFDRYENSFLWLKDAGVAIPVYNADELRSPLEQSRSSNLFKLFMNDIGMLNNFYPAAVRARILMRDGTVNNGALFENAAAQQLTANGLTPYFYKHKTYGEIDLVVEPEGEALPLEIKSGKNYRTHAALNNILSMKDPHVSKAYVFADANVSLEGRIHYMPIYMLMFLKEKSLDEEMKF